MGDFDDGKESEGMAVQNCKRERRATRVKAI